MSNSVLRFNFGKVGEFRAVAGIFTRSLRVPVSTGLIRINCLTFKLIVFPNFFQTTLFLYFSFFVEL